MSESVAIADDKEGQDQADPVEPATRIVSKDPEECVMQNDNPLHHSRCSMMRNVQLYHVFIFQGHMGLLCYCRARTRQML